MGNILVLALFAVLGATYKSIPLSRQSYARLFLFIGFHECGARHQSADVPLGEWMKIWLHSTRNPWRYWFPIVASVAFEPFTK